MNEASVADFRCFAERRTARLAPLTLLVGANGTGKTSFLALVRALWDVVVQDRIPNFKERPYDLGTFDDLVHRRGGRSRRPETFEAGCAWGGANGGASADAPLRWDVTFRRYGSGALPGLRRVADGSAWADCEIADDGTASIGVGTRRGSWRFTPVDSVWRLPAPTEWRRQSPDLPPFGLLIRTLLHSLDRPEFASLFEGGEEAGSPGERDREEIAELLERVSRSSSSPYRPSSSAPTRSCPKRTYDDGSAMPDPEGEYAPRLLAALARDDAAAWDRLKASLEEFGRDSGLFDEIRVKELDGSRTGPFHIQARKWGARAKGPYRNLIDVGYGTSQALPVVVDLLLRPAAPRTFLLQQPEIHLHPSAQAALGGLLARVAASAREPLVVETHSDHLIDRIRMDVRDGRTELAPDDVSILYFEPVDRSVAIHSLGWDDNGNLVAREGAIPESYRRFFREERWRSLGV